MGFLQPLLLLGLLGVAVPIAVHLVNRKKAVRQSFPAIWLLAASKRQTAPASKLKQRLLLAARILTFLALPLAFAQPFLSGEVGGASSRLDRLPSSVVIVLDDSASMSWGRDGSAERFAAAVDAASSAIGDLRSWDEVSLIVASSPPQLLTGDLSTGHGTVRKALEEYRPRFGGGDLAGALEQAKAMHASSKLPQHRTILLTDRTQTQWAAPPLAEALRGLGEVELPVLVEGEGSGNLAVESLTVQPADDGTAGRYRFEAQLRSSGNTGAGEREVRLFDGATQLGVSKVLLPASGRATAVFQLKVEGNELHDIRAEVTEQVGMTADNSRHLAFQPGRALRVLLVNGDARSVTYADELFFLEHALSAGDGASGALEAVSVGAESLAGQPLEGFDLVVLANLARLSKDDQRRLLAFVQAGHGLLTTVGNNAVAEELNATFGTLLPRPVRSVKVLCEAADPDANLKAVRISSIDRGHPIFRIFSAPGGQTISSALVFRYITLEPAATEGAKTLASFSDGAPALVERSEGAGRVAMLATTVDLEWNDLAIRTAYLPLMRRLASYLARQSSERRVEAEVGSEQVIDAAALTPERLTVVSPSGARSVLEGPEGRYPFRPIETGLHGVIVTAGGVDTAADSLYFSVNAPAAESNLQQASADAVAAVIAKSGEGLAGSAAESGSSSRRDLWPWLLFGALLLVYAESFLQVRRRVWKRLGERLQAARS